jgi:hypothetical protein
VELGGEAADHDVVDPVAVEYCEDSFGIEPLWCSRLLVGGDGAAGEAGFDVVDGECLEFDGAEFVGWFARVRGVRRRCGRGR